MFFVAALSLSIAVAGALAQQRCDDMFPTVYCNTTQVLQYESRTCTNYHIFLARGSDEPYPGRLGNLTSIICARIGRQDCSFENVIYPARSTAWGQEEWCKSASQGQRNGQAQMKAYGQKCPQSKLILLGFSQGAAVAQDILGGGGGRIFACQQESSLSLDATTAPGSNGEISSEMILLEHAVTDSRFVSQSSQPQRSAVQFAHATRTSQLAMGLTSMVSELTIGFNWRL